MEVKYLKRALYFDFANSTFNSVKQVSSLVRGYNYQYQVHLIMAGENMHNSMSPYHCQSLILNIAINDSKSHLLQCENTDILFLCSFDSMEKKMAS